MSEITEKLKALGEKWANLPSGTEANEIADECMEMIPAYISELQRSEFLREQAEKACAEEKAWSEELAHDICEMEDALGFKQDCTDKDGAFVPTKGKWKERVRDLIAMEGELGDLQKACAEMRDLSAELLKQLRYYCQCKAKVDSTLCGPDYIHRDKVKPLVEALEMAAALSTGQDCDPAHHGVVVAAMDALTHAERLKGETK